MTIVFSAIERAPVLGRRLSHATDTQGSFSGPSDLKEGIFVPNNRDATPNFTLDSFGYRSGSLRVTLLVINPGRQGSSNNSSDEKSAHGPPPQPERFVSPPTQGAFHITSVPKSIGTVPAAPSSVAKPKPAPVVEAPKIVGLARSVMILPRRSQITYRLSFSRRTSSSAQKRPTDPRPGESEQSPSRLRQLSCLRASFRPFSSRHNPRGKVSL